MSNLSLALSSVEVSLGFRFASGRSQAGSQIRAVRAPKLGFSASKRWWFALRIGSCDVRNAGGQRHRIAKSRSNRSLPRTRFEQLDDSEQLRPLAGLVIV